MFLGYGLVQLRAAGDEDVGFEVSTSRAADGRQQLGVNVIHSHGVLDGLPPGAFDVILASHVPEHLPTGSEAFRRFARLARTGEFIVAFVPNGGGRSARSLGAGWGALVCEKHTLAINREFLARSLPQNGFDVHVTSALYHSAEVRRMLDARLKAGDTCGDELLIAARWHENEGRAAC